ncbi:MAG TPA: hypothetical protein ENK52_04585, partial [Saprospiraceae bacterium]|nr:hypothetical protein [Saprospiraceae bacterium]
MHKPLLYIIFLILSLPLSMEAQKCVCIECPQNTINNDTLKLTYNIQSTVDTLLSSPTQGICGVNVKFKHDVIGDMLIKLVSPSGQSITLVGPHVVSASVTNLTTWDVSFVQCSSNAIPDPGFNQLWTNNQAWAFFSLYDGSYYPNVGCLENFNAGSVNGTWTLQVIDAQQTASVFTGEVLDFSITLCNPIGLDCFNCEAEGGTLNETDFAYCQGEEQLNISTSPTYAGAGPDVISYGYGYVLSEGGVIEQFLDSVDLRMVNAGLYDICGI